MKISVLFVCTHNSARSQMAEELLRLHAPERFEVESAGYEPADKVLPVVAEVMKERGVDLSHKVPRNVYKVFEEGGKYDYVITVCKECADRGCPFFPYEKEFLKWSFKDPESLRGTQGDMIKGTKDIMAQIEEKVLEFIDYATDQ